MGGYVLRLGLGNVFSPESSSVSQGVPSGMDRVGGCTQRQPLCLLFQGAELLKFLGISS